MWGEPLPSPLWVPVGRPWNIGCPRFSDVEIEILYCGVCHSDLHAVRNDWGGSRYPLVPGHEIVGKVKAIGSAVKNYEKGDTVAVGCMVDSCQSCKQCDNGEEQFCQIIQHVMPEIPFPIFEK